MLIGAPYESNNHLYNSLLLIKNGRVKPVQFKETWPVTAILMRTLFAAGREPIPSNWAINLLEL